MEEIQEDKILRATINSNVIVARESSIKHFKDLIILLYHQDQNVQYL